MALTSIRTLAARSFRCTPCHHVSGSSSADLQSLRRFLAHDRCVWPPSRPHRTLTVTRVLNHRFKDRNAASRKDTAISSIIPSQQPTENDGDTESSTPRNKKLAAVVREGIASLNQAATAISTNAHTTKSIFAPTQHEDVGTDPRVLAEEHRIFTTAHDCLDDLCHRDPAFPLMAADEPILLIGVKVKASMSHADLYWALPYRILSSRKLTTRQKDILRDEMEERVNGAPGRVLIRRVNAVLSSYFPPKLRFKVAPPLLLHDVLQDLEED